MSKTISTGTDKDEGTPKWYRKMYLECEIDKGYERSVIKNSELVLEGRDKYQQVSDKTGIPWYVIGIIHFKEGSCNFLKCMANGEKIIGTGRKTTIVPIGRGPYSTWEESAIDAISISSLRKVNSWELGTMLAAVERYNGSGHISGKGKSETSPYLWARTNVNDDFGKYTSDGKFSPIQGTNKTSGFCAILKQLESIGAATIVKIVTINELA